jgi:hypothetical protein
LLKRVVLGALAGMIALSTGILVVAAGREFSLDRIWMGAPLTVTAALGLLGLVFVIVGAGAAARRILVSVVRRRGDSQGEGNLQSRKG